MVRAEAAHREVTDQLAALIEHRRKSDAADGRHTIRHYVIEPLCGTRAVDLKLSVS